MDLGFVWDETKYEAVRQRHGVRFDEVVSVFEDEDAFELDDPQGNLERSMLVGRTHTGRILQVVYQDDYTAMDSMIYRLITAFDAVREWSDEYKRRV
jgi:uncharacterized DUF497 family protein